MAEVDDLCTLLYELMPVAIDMVVPLQIEVKQGPNWRDLEPLVIASGAAAGG